MKKLDLFDPNIVRLINQYSNEILEIVDKKDEFTQSDLQGALEAIVMKILRAGLDLS